MKKRFLALAACALALTACGAKTAQVQPAKLTEAEQELVALVENSGRTKLFDVDLPEGTQWMDIAQATLVDGQWRQEMVMGGVPAGRLCLRVAGRGEVVYASVGGATSRMEGEPAGSLPEGSGYTETWLTAPVPLALDAETPVYLYIESADGSVEALPPSTYATPEKLAGYTRVTAITVRPTAQD